jgi:hypothetical protein
MGRGYFTADEEQRMGRGYFTADEEQRMGTRSGEYHSG